jgi:hypothetical protein
MWTVEHDESVLNQLYPPNSVSRSIQLRTSRLRLLPVPREVLLVTRADGVECHISARFVPLRLDRERLRIELQQCNRSIVSCYTRHKWCAHAFEQARGGSGAWYAMELTELLPHVVCTLNINWNEATRYVGLNPDV